MNYISRQIVAAAVNEGRLEAGIVAVLFFGQRETNRKCHSRQTKGLLLEKKQRGRLSIDLQRGILRNNCNNLGEVDY